MWGRGRQLKREVIYVYLWLIHAVLQKPTHYKAVFPQLNIFLKKRKKKQPNDSKCVDNQVNTCTSEYKGLNLDFIFVVCINS